MPHYVTPELANAAYSNHSPEFWLLVKEISDMAVIAHRDNWVNSSPNVTRSEAVSIVNQLSSSLRAKIAIDFPDAFVNDIVVKLPKPIGINNIESVISNVAIQVLQHVHDITQAERKSRLSIPDALCILQLLYEGVGMPVIRATGNSSIISYLTELMDLRKIVNSSKGNSSYATMAYSTWMGNAKVGRNHITLWEDPNSRKRYYYLSKRIKKLRGREEDDSLTEYERAWERVKKMGVADLDVSLKSIIDNLCASISQFERTKIMKYEFPTEILSDTNFILDLPEDYKNRKRIK